MGKTLQSSIKKTHGFYRAIFFFYIFRGVFSAGLQAQKPFAMKYLHGGPLVVVAYQFISGVVTNISKKSVITRVLPIHLL